MKVDVTTEIVIDRPVGEMSAYAADPDNAPRWYANITSVEWQTEPPLRPGSLVAFVAQLETTYTWTAESATTTRMTLRNAGEPAGFSTVAGPFMSVAVRRANRKDLARLKAVLEQAPPSP